MDQKCTKIHDGVQPNEKMIAFCTNLQCKHRLACGMCYHDYHQDHISQLVSIREFYTFAQKQLDLQNNRPRAQQIEQLQILKAEIISLIDEKCNAFINENQPIQPIIQLLDGVNIEQGITEYLVEQLLNPKMFKAQDDEALQNLTKSLQQIKTSLKVPVKVENLVYEVQNQVYDNCTYSGKMLNDKRHGLGIAQYTNGAMYEGEWKNDKRSGEGVYLNEEGDTQIYIQIRYTGTWKNSKKNGFGKYVQKNGNIYEGMWVDSEKCGQGKMIFAGGQVYEGEWKQNRRNGFGINQWPNGDKYEGEWKDDKKHGKGIHKLSTGFYDGEWVDNKKCGKGYMKLECGEWYKGEFADDKRNGEGINHYANGQMYQYEQPRYEGQFKDSKRCGFGTMKFPSGESYTGQWAENKRNGKGINRSANGRTQEGNWVNDVKEGFFF